MCVLKKNARHRHCWFLLFCPYAVSERRAKREANDSMMKKFKNKYIF
jgi:hypothetical protein